MPSSPRSLWCHCNGKILTTLTALVKVGVGIQPLVLVPMVRYLVSGMSVDDYCGVGGDGGYG